MAKKQEPKEPVDIEDNNAKMAMRMIRREIKRLLDQWDPQCLRGLPGFENEYNEVCGPLGVMVRKRQEPMEIAAHLDRLVQEKWNLPPCREKCLQIAEKIHRTGCFLDG